MAVSVSQSHQSSDRTSCLASQITLGTFLSPSEGGILGGPLCAPGIYMASRESDLWSSHLQDKHFLNCCEPGPDHRTFTYTFFILPLTSLLLYTHFPVTSTSTLIPSSSPPADATLTFPCQLHSQILLLLPRPDPWQAVGFLVSSSLVSASP